MSASDPDRPSPLDLLRTLTYQDFLAGFIQAEQRRNESRLVFEEYAKWFSRLEPYLQSDPLLTVDEAISRYRADCRARERRE